MLKNPGFTAVAVLTLALGIGANSAVFSVVNSILLRPLPFRDSDRLVNITHSYPKLNITTPVSAPNFLDYRDQAGVFESAAISTDSSYILTDHGEPEHLLGLRVSASYFRTLGIETALGRSFLPEEDQLGQEHVVILSHGLWQRRFGSDQGVLGRTLMLNKESYIVVGIMPESLYGETDVWVPLALSPSDMAPSARGWEYLTMAARLNPQVSVQEAQTAMEHLAVRIRQQNPSFYSGDRFWKINVKSLYEETVSDIRSALFLLFIAVGFVLLIACANVANLLLARSATRRTEILTRAALGASRIRLVRQLLTENILLSLLGGGIGFLISLWGVKVLVALDQKAIPRWQEIRVDSRVLVFTLSVSLLTVVLFGLTPAFQSSKVELSTALKEKSRKSSIGFRWLNFRSLLAASEVALALALLIGAGLLLRSFARVLEVNLGFQPKNILSMQISLPNFKYPEPEQRRAFYERALEQIRALPGVKSVGAISNLPLSGLETNGPFTIRGRQMTAVGQQPQSDLRSVSPEYLQTMDIPLKRGRYFTEQDRVGAPEVVIIDEVIARAYFQNEEPLGKQINLDGDEHPRWREIVGVVGPIKYKRPDIEYQGQLYFPHSQDPWGSIGNMYLTVRTASEPTSLASAVREAIYRIDKEQPLYRLITMEQLVVSSVAQRRFSMFLLTLFAALALLLSVVGIYSILSYSVTEWTHEIGVRLALGAQKGDVLRFVLWQGLIQVLAGIGIGLAFVFAFTRMMSSLLFNVSPTDPLTLFIIPLLFVAVAVVACYLPARRAMKVDPVIALRYE